MKSLNRIWFESLLSAPTSNTDTSPLPPGSLVDVIVLVVRAGQFRQAE
jgi:hypothetical protein